MKLESAGVHSGDVPEQCQMPCLNDFDESQTASLGWMRSELHEQPAVYRVLNFFYFSGFLLELRFDEGGGD